MIALTRAAALLFFAEKYPLRKIGKNYLHRYALRGYLPDGVSPESPDVNIYLHNFRAPDKARHLHNHPWPWAVSVILCGSYLERRVEGEAWRSPGDVVSLRSDTYHSIDEIVGDVWTLFVTSNQHSSWGFRVPGEGHVPHGEYEKRFPTANEDL